MGMQYTVAAMGAFPGEGNLGARAIELGAPLDQLFDAHRTFFHQDAGCRLVTQSVAGFQRVVEMQADFVVVAERGRDAALRVLRVRFGDFTLGEAKHTPRRSEFHGSAQTRDACTYYDEIGFAR